MEDIIIGGYTLEELKKVQAGVKKDASKIIADAIKAGEEAVKEIINLSNEDNFEDEDEKPSEEIATKINELAVIAENELAKAKLVSDISGVSYYLPFREDGYGDSYYYDLECNYRHLPDNGAVDALMSILEDMEYDSCNWHSSRC